MFREGGFSSSSSGGRGGRGSSREKVKLGPGGKPMGRRRDKKDDVLSIRMKKKTCRFCEEKILSLDYKDIKRLERLVSERGKILSRRVTGTCAKHQRKVEDVVKKARIVALLPFCKS